MADQVIQLMPQMPLAASAGEGATRTFVVRASMPSAADENPRALAVSVFVTEHSDDLNRPASSRPKQVYVLQGVWRNGEWESLSAPSELWQLERVQHLLGHTMLDVQEQQRRLSARRRGHRRLLMALAPVLFAWCVACAAAVGSWMNRNHVVDRAVQHKHEQMQRDADARIAAATTAARQREANITIALRRESERRAQFEQEIRAMDNQRHLEGLSRDALNLILRGEADAYRAKLAEAIHLLGAAGDRRGQTLLLISAGAALMQKNEYTAAESHLVEALQLIHAIEPADQALTVDVLALWAQSLLHQDRFDDANEACKRLLLIEPGRHGSQRDHLCDALAQLAHLYVEKAHYDQGAIVLERALHFAGHQLGNTSDWRLLARLYVRQRRYAEAEGVYKKLIESREETLGSDDLILADDAAELAELYERQDRFGEAEALYKLAMSIRENVLGPYHDDVARSALHLANLYRLQGQATQADALQELARDIRRKSLTEHP